MKEEIVFTFSTTSHAIAAETFLLEAGFSLQVMPLPSKIQAGCGICLRLSPTCQEKAQVVLKEHSIPIHAIYQREVQDGQSIYTKCEEVE